MQSHDENTGSKGAVNHPGAEEWMAYLYDEIAPERKRELHAHVGRCAACGEQLNHWRAGMVALDDWKLPAMPRKTPAWQPATMLKWAVAAALVLCVGFALGRVSSSNARELDGLKTAVAQLSGQINERPVAVANNPSAEITKQARDEMVQLLAAYSKLDEDRRDEDRRVIGLVLQEMESRLIKLRSELETVAVNTASGFKQTREGLTTLASYTVADHRGATDSNNPETKN